MSDQGGVLRRSYKLAAALSAMILALTACGDDGDDGADDN